MGGFELLVARYGLGAIFLGVFIEGETALTIGGFAAHQHLMPLWAVWLVAVVAAFLADQLWFHVARRNKAHPRIVRLSDSRAGKAALSAVSRGQGRFAFVVRFIFGMRTAGPLALGLSDMSAKRFAVIDAVAAALWAALWAGLGFLFGKTVEAVLGNLAHAEHRLIAALVLGVVSTGVVWLAGRLFLSRGPNS